jgi:hypothetical protein
MDILNTLCNEFMVTAEWIEQLRQVISDQQEKAVLRKAVIELCCFRGDLSRWTGCTNDSMDMPKASDLHNETLIIKLIKSCKQNLDMVHETLLDAQKQVGSTLILEDLRRINNFLKDIKEHLDHMYLRLVPRTVYYAPVYASKPQMR